MIILLLRSVLLYLVLIVCVRLMGKRQIGEMEPSEFVITMLIANLAAIPMQDTEIPLLSGLIPILSALSLELIFAFLSLRSIRLRRLLCGSPVILIENGEICQENLRRTRVTLDELTEHLREHGILDLTTVRYAILETNGQLSTFQYAESSPPTAAEQGIAVTETELPYTLISDGRVLGQNLKALGKSRAWLDGELRKAGVTVREVFLMTEDGSGKRVLVRKEMRK